MIRKARAQTVALMLLTPIAFGACSSTEAVQESASTGPQTSTSSTSAVAAAKLSEVAKAAGATCSTGPKESKCALGGVNFTLSDEGWTSQRDLREKACKQGYVNQNYVVLTDGHGMVSADSASDRQSLLQALRAGGADVREASYCPQP